MRLYEMETVISGAAQKNDFRYLETCVRFSFDFLTPEAATWYDPFSACKFGVFMRTFKISDDSHKNWECYTLPSPYGHIIRGLPSPTGNHFTSRRKIGH